MLKNFEYFILKILEIMKKFNIYNKQFRYLFKKLEYKIKIYLCICSIQSIPEIYKYRLNQMNLLSRSFLYTKNSCILSYRNRAILKKIKLSRLMFKRYISNGLIIGYQQIM